MGFAEDFVGELKKLQFKDAFNPYATCTDADRSDAPALRRETLRSIIENALARRRSKEVVDMWVGQSLGRFGGKRTGLAFTDDITFPRHCERWGVEPVCPTEGRRVPEDTATAVWRELETIPTAVFLWNAFPLHPHRRDSETNRTKLTTDESAAGRVLLLKLINELRPRRLIAVGVEAHEALRIVAGGRAICYVRHPGRNGEREFSAGIQELYSEWCRGV